MTDDDGRPLPDEPVTAGVAAAPEVNAGEAEPQVEPESHAEPEPEPDLAPGGRALRLRLAPGPAPEPEPAADPEPDLAPGGRALPLRLARLHLRLGSLALARAELESFAGAGMLDEPALLDLAEARWRTGDLAGAGEAANAAIGRGVGDPLALVIAAETVAAVGRPAEARRLAARALADPDLALDPLFAGMPRSLIWPVDAPVEEAAGIAVVASRARPDASRAVGDPGPASPAAAEAYAGGRGSLARGDVATAALRLGVAIRLEPGFAQAVLNAIGDRASEPVLALVAGDALRLLGREHEALAAYDTARGKPSVPRAEPQDAEPGDAAPSWPGDADFV